VAALAGIGAAVLRRDGRRGGGVAALGAQHLPPAGTDGSDDAAREAGALDARVGPGGQRRRDRPLAGHLDHLLDTIDDKTRELSAGTPSSTPRWPNARATLATRRRHLVRSEKLAAVGQLTASIAHEVNNPIAVIQGNLDLLRELLGAPRGRRRPS
jgi:signal transduction histidine kinase